MAAIIEKFVSADIPDGIIAQAADLFSLHYGVWGSIAKEKTGVHEGSRVKMSLDKLRKKILPPFTSPNCKHIYVRGLLLSTTSAYHPPFSVGHAFATRFLHNHRPVLWITQLVVHSAHRNQGIAKALLEALREENAEIVGVLSSNPFAIAAVLRVFGSGLEKVEKVLEMTRRNARRVMTSCPIEYVRNSTLRGTLFSDMDDIEDLDGKAVVSCADNGFWVDHQESEQALKVLKAKGVKWPLGELPEGCEFLILVEVRNGMTMGPIYPQMVQGMVGKTLAYGLS